MKTIAKRLCRLERAFAAADRKPRDYFRVVLQRLRHLGHHVVSRMSHFALATSRA